MTTPCIVFPGPSQVTLGEIEIGPPGPGRLRTRTRLSAVSTGTETRVFRGKQPGSTFPLIPGYENIGEVVEAGPGTSLPIGQRLYLRNNAYDPAPYNKTWGAQVAGSVTIEATAVPIPDEVPDEHAMFVRISAISLHGVKRGRVTAGEQVVVVGMGIVGHFCMQHAIARGAEVIAVDTDDARLKVALDGGASHALNAGASDVADEIRSITNGGADVAFDATGNAAALEPTAKYLRARAPEEDLGKCPRLVLQGSVEAPLILDARSLTSPEIDLISARDCDREDLLDSVALMAAGRLHPEVVPVTTFSYKDAAAAYAKLINREIMRVHFTWD